VAEQRSRAGRARAELALVRLLHELNDDEVPLVVLGGLVPELLAREDDLVPQHLGTTDVAVPLITHVQADADLGGVERALTRIDFRPDPDEDGWRWQGLIDEVPVKLEPRCDLPDHREREVIRPRGSKVLAAANLLAKCVAARWRAAAKDYFDFAYVLLHNRHGGPEGAAERLRSGELADALPALRSTFIEIRKRYVKSTDSGPTGYALQALGVDPNAGEARPRADAVDMVQRFFAALRL